MILLLCGAALASAESSLDAANAALAAGDAATAEAGYRALIDEGYTGGDVYYNFGNVLWREGKVPGAILAWRTAEARAPRDPDVQANLEFARRSLRDGLDTRAPVPWFAPWQVAFTSSETLWAGFGLIGFGLLVIAARGRLPHQPMAGVGVAAGLLGATVAAGGWVDAALPPVGVVLAAEVTATSDLGGGVDLFELHGGAEVLVVEDEAGSVLIQLPDGRKGWIPAGQVGRAVPGSTFPVL